MLEILINTHKLHLRQFAIRIFHLQNSCYACIQKGSKFNTALNFKFQLFSLKGDCDHCRDYENFFDTPDKMSNVPLIYAGHYRQDAGQTMPFNILLQNLRWTKCPASREVTLDI